MKIIEEFCVDCGKCEIECHLKAIHQNKNSGHYEIDETICNNCVDLMDVQCVRGCGVNAIMKEGKDSTYERVPINYTMRLQPVHLQWFIGIMGARGNGDFCINREHTAFRTLISKLILNPEEKVRLVPIYDDVCVGCDRKQEPEHRESLAKKDDILFKELGIEPGTVMRMWDALKFFEEKITVKLLRDINTPEFVILNYLEGISHAAANREKAKE